MSTQVQVLCGPNFVSFEGEKIVSSTRSLPLPGSENYWYSVYRRRQVNSQIPSVESGVFNDLLNNLAKKGCSAERTLNMVREEEAPSVMDMIQLHLDAESSHHDLQLRKTCIESLLLLNKRHSVLPTSIHLDQVTRDGLHPVSGGGFADIYKGRLEDKQAVCLKVLRVYTATYDEKKLMKQLSNEVLIWRQLQHPNVLQLLGVTGDLFKPSYCIISPWMENGDVISYARVNEAALDDRVRMIHEISEGVRYLHEHHPPIVHSDIKGLNILVSDEGKCCLADFGLATVENDVSDGQVHLNTSQAVVRGSVPWLAPELMNPDHVVVPNRKTRDIYALGCTIFELLTGTAPFSEKKMDFQIIMEVLNGSRPVRPANCPDWLWDVVESCWMEDSQARPTAAEVTSLLFRRTSRGKLEAAQDSSVLLHPTGGGALGDEGVDSSKISDIEGSGTAQALEKDTSPLSFKKLSSSKSSGIWRKPAPRSAWERTLGDNGTDSSRRSNTEGSVTVQAQAEDTSTPWEKAMASLKATQIYQQKYDGVDSFTGSPPPKKKSHRLTHKKSPSLSFSDPAMTTDSDHSPTRMGESESSSTLTPAGSDRVDDPALIEGNASHRDGESLYNMGILQEGSLASSAQTPFYPNEPQLDETPSQPSRKRRASPTPLEESESPNKRARAEVSLRDPGSVSQVDDENASTSDARGHLHNYDSSRTVDDLIACLLEDSSEDECWNEVVLGDEWWGEVDLGDEVDVEEFELIQAEDAVVRSLKRRAHLESAPVVQTVRSSSVPDTQTEPKSNTTSTEEPPSPERLPTPSLPLTPYTMSADIPTDFAHRMSSDLAFLARHAYATVASPFKLIESENGLATDPYDDDGTAASTLAKLYGEEAVAQEESVLDGAERSVKDMWGDVLLRDAWKRFRARVGIH